MECLEKNYTYMITAKTPDRITKKFIFTLKHLDGISINRTADQIFRDKGILFELSAADAYDVGFTHGHEALVKFENELVEMKKSQKLQD